SLFTQRDEGELDQTSIGVFLSIASFLTTTTKESGSSKYLRETLGIVFSFSFLLVFGFDIFSPQQKGPLIHEYWFAYGLRHTAFGMSFHLNYLIANIIYESIWIKKEGCLNFIRKTLIYFM
ncbi:hypothetical protein ACJX0J_040138, partial [Zea mays]